MKIDPPSRTRLNGVTLLAGVLAGFFVGCLPTAVHPFYRTGDLFHDPSLLGVWETADGSGRWTFTTEKSPAYKLEIQIDNQRVVCVAHLFKLGDEQFLDLYPEARSLDEQLRDNPYNIGLVPAHALIRVHQISSKLRMSCMANEWLTAELKSDPGTTAHVLLPDGRVALTSGTDALQAFVRKHIGNTAAWSMMYDDGLVRAGHK